MIKLENMNKKKMKKITLKNFGNTKFITLKKQNTKIINTEKKKNKMKIKFGSKKYIKLNLYIKILIFL